MLLCRKRPRQAPAAGGTTLPKIQKRPAVPDERATSSACLRSRGNGQLKKEPGRGTEKAADEQVSGVHCRMEHRSTAVLRTRTAREVAENGARRGNGQAQRRLARAALWRARRFPEICAGAPAPVTACNGASTELPHETSRGGECAILAALARKP